MRILHVNSYYETCPFYKNLYDLQAAGGDEISVFVSVPRGYDAGGRDFGPYATVSANHLKLDRLCFPLKNQKMTRDCLRRYDAADYDLIHAHSLFTNGCVAYRLHQRFGTPYLVAVRDTDVNVFFRRMPHLRGLGRKILRHASRVIFLSQPYRDTSLLPYLNKSELADVRKKSEIVTNGVDPMWLADRPRTHRAPGERIELLCVGQISRRKNMSAAARAAGELRRRGRDAHLTVVGRTVDPGEAEALKAFDFVTVLPQRPMAELKPLYRESDVFVLPSRRETFGLVYAEAMSQGLPVLYTRGQGFDGQFAPGEVGYPVACDDAVEMADRVEDALADYGRMSGNCLKQSDRYDWRFIAAYYAGIYKGVRNG